MEYLFCDKSPFVVILQISYRPLMIDMKIRGRAIWRHNLDMLHIRAGLCDWNSSNVNDMMKWLIVLLALVAFAECLNR